MINIAPLTQEYGGIGAFISGKEWVAGRCHTYLAEDSPHAEANAFIGMVRNVSYWRSNTSVIIYTQISDVEL